jgi:hypothetical protein
MRVSRMAVGRRSFLPDRVFAGLAVILSLASCGSGISGARGLAPTKSEAPVLNSHRKLLVRIFGNVDRSFSVRIFALYLSSAPECRRAMNLLEGAYSPIGVWTELTVHRTRNQYEALVALDRYREGKCRWNARLIAFYITDQNGIATEGSALGLELPGNTGPIPFIWVQEPGKEDILVADPTHPGVQTLPTITVRCREGDSVDSPRHKLLYCLDISPRITAVINDEANKVHLNILRVAEGPPGQP